MVGHPEADPAAVDEVLPDRVAPFGLTLEKKVNRINKDVFLRQYREFKYSGRRLMGSRLMGSIG